MFFSSDEVINLGKEKKKTLVNVKKLFPMFILLATIFMGIGYASINSIILEFGGNANAKEIDGVYITEVNYVSDVNADVNNSRIINAYQTNLNSQIALSTTDVNSSITYSVTFYNATDKTYYFYDVDFVDDETTYSNSDITFTVVGANQGTALNSKQYITFKVVFSYKDNILSENNILNSYLNFVFKEKFSITYENINDINNYPSEIYEGEMLQIDFSSSSIRNIKVYVDDVEFNNYTFVDSKLTIENVSSNLVIRGISDYDGYDVPVTDETSDFIIIESTTQQDFTVSDLFNKEISGVNASSKIITRIEVDITYTSSTGSKQSIISTLTHNGKTYNQTSSFSGKATNQKITVVFDNLSINYNDVFSVTYTADKITNGNIQITTGELKVYFQ